MVERSDISAEGADRGISRRDALKRGAIAGGAVVWATPLVQNIGMSQAFATHGTPVPPPGNLKGISFIVFRFQCGNQTYAVKVDDPGEAGQTCGPIPGDNPGQDCGIEAEPGDINGGAACGLFTIHVDATKPDGDVIQVTVNFTGNCTILEGASKCADDCVAYNPNANGNGVFLGCPQ